MATGSAFSLSPCSHLRSATTPTGATGRFTRAAVVNEVTAVDMRMLFRINEIEDTERLMKVVTCVPVSWLPNFPLTAGFPRNIVPLTWKLVEEMSTEAVRNSFYFAGNGMVDGYGVEMCMNLGVSVRSSFVAAVGTHRETGTSTYSVVESLLGED
ncbi:MAG: hypothetical protein M1839_007922 [Geoglossum umbratile]|nr:MAG: hypothetical protein M1839_007922 [Geoglossum umbratile]